VKEKLRVSREYLYVFGYETPAQRDNNAAHGWDDEDSAALFIIAETAQRALEWGRTVSRRYVSALFNDGAASWDESRFAAWLDHDYAANFSPDQLVAIPTVTYGEYPDIAGMLRSKYGKTAATATGSSF